MKLLELADALLGEAVLVGPITVMDGPLAEGERSEDRRVWSVQYGGGPWTPRKEEHVGAIIVDREGNVLEWRAHKGAADVATRVSALIREEGR